MTIQSEDECARSRSSSSDSEPPHDDYGRIEGQGVWTEDEHHRFLHGISLYPHGPWRNVAAIVRTRSIRQTQTHAQKLKQKLARHRRGLRSKSYINEELAKYQPTWTYSNVSCSLPHSPTSGLWPTHSKPISAVFSDGLTLPSFEDSLDYLLIVLDDEMLVTA
ncbi:Aste57867_20590 [Aphanomyces stellatus]|uniref:Aste57867_20590 protein n=1 Tax=Aphanomyces stellatus TaxID=120398 RepID=A0A485LFE5_9STRA|nr:hypothetical protein As57867_020523 [Aphanomyces stellatus]VFT97271.1 Aste57867_20590 [Aphanomyces stellatus]